MKRWEIRLSGQKLDVIAAGSLIAATKQQALHTFAPTPVHSEMFAAPVIVAREPTCKQAVLHLHG